MSFSLSIIIPTFNTRDMTIACIGHIFKNLSEEHYEIIVVDNHSSDGTVEALRETYPNVAIIQNPRNLGFAKACNRGAQEAKGQYLCFLNSDTVAQPQTFQTLVEWMDNHPRTGIVGPELLGANGQRIQMSWSWNPVLFYELIQQYFAPYGVKQSALKRRIIGALQSRSRKVPSICGACLMIRRQAFDEILGFDEDFELYFEDSDLCYRCLRQNWSIDFVAESKIVHQLGQSTRGSWSATSLIYQQSHITYYRKHAPRWGLALLKGYLLLKWLRLRWRVWKEKERSEQGLAYCRAYRQMVLEKERFTLEKGYPA